MGPSLKKYSDFFGRNPDFIREPLGEPKDSPFVYRFPEMKAGFFKRLRVPVSDVWVFITDGMSAKEMTVPNKAEASYPSRIELVAYAEHPVIGQSDDEDIITAVLQALALLPFEKNIFFGPLLTCNFGANICLNSEMTGFFFGVPGGVNMNRLCKCTQSADLAVSVIPISAAELKFVSSKGPDELVELFDKNGVPNLFDPFRKSLVP